MTASRRQDMPLQWRNGDERPWKEIVDDQEQAGWVVGLDELVWKGWQPLDWPEARLGRDKDDRIFLLVSPSSVMWKHLATWFPSSDPEVVLEALFSELQLKEMWNDPDIG